jgi:hypothetical protein
MNNVEVKVLRIFRKMLGNDRRNVKGTEREAS